MRKFEKSARVRDDVPSPLAASTPQEALQAILDSRETLKVADVINDAMIDDMLRVVVLIAGWVRTRKSPVLPKSVRKQWQIDHNRMATTVELFCELLNASDLRLPRLSTQGPAPVAGEAAATAPAAPSAGADPRTLNPRDTSTSALPSYIEEIERAAIQQALQENRYNKTRTAAALGITFRALRYKLKKLGID